MKKKIIALSCVVIMAVLAAAGRVYFLGATLDELPGMAIIEDTNGDRIAVEPTSGDAWNDLVKLHHSKGEKWVGGIVEVFLLFEYDPNYPWGFRLNPETIIVADVTAEGLQTTLRDISGNMDYWVGMGYAYVWAEVVELRHA